MERRPLKRLSQEENENHQTSSDEEQNYGEGKAKRTSRKRRKVKLDEEYENGSDDDEDEENISPENGESEAGQITKVHVENFMCHRKFTLNLGRNLNFITGKNGSGKSAVVAALQLCLGATARTTGRGSNLSGLVREGSPGPAILQVTLFNEGEGAYQPEVFGNRIVVERRIAVAGATNGGYRLCSSNDRVIKLVSPHKSDIMAMLLHFNIFVDNPCCILTQEESKKFIHGHETDKYDFFLKATGLYAVGEKNSEIKEELDSIDDLLPLKKTKLQEKKEEGQHYKQIRDRLTELSGIDDSIRLCIAKGFWDDVRVADSVVQQAEEAVADQQQSLQQAEQELSQHDTGNSGKKEELAMLRSQIEASEEEHQRISSLIGDLQQRIREIGRQKGEIKTDQNTCKSSIQDYKKRKTAVVGELRELRDRAMRDAQVEEREAMQQKETCESALNELRQKEQQLRETLNLNEKNKRQKKDHQRQLNGQVEGVKSAIRSIERDIQSMDTSNAQGGKAAMFGRQVPDLLRLIANTRFEDPVLGPVGMLVSLESDCQKWSDAVEKSISRCSRSFIVSNARDRITLMGLMRRVNCHTFNPIIMQAKHARYQVDSMKTARLSGDRCGLSVADALVVKDDTVFNCLVDQASIDMIALVDSTDVFLQDYVVTQNGRDDYKIRMGSAVTLDGTTIRIVSGNRSNEAFRGRFMKYLTADSTNYVRGLKQELAVKQQEYTELTRRNEQVNQEHYELQNHCLTIERSVAQISAEIKKLNKEKQQIDDQLIDMQAAGQIDTSELEREDQELQLAIELMEEQKTGLADSLQRVEEQEKALRKEKQLVDLEKSNIEKNDAAIEKKINAILSEFQGNERQKASLERKVRENKDKVERCEQALKSAMEVSAKKTQEAYERTADLVKDWDGNPLKLTAKETKQSLLVKEKKLRAELENSKKERQLQNYSLAEVIEKFAKLKQEFREMSELYRTLEERFDTLTEDNNARQLKWGKELKKQSKMTKLKFDTYAQQKNAAGSVKFDHEGHKLHLMYQVDNTDSNTRAKDVKQLSGGERSFVTFCLLLALGHSIDCPFRLMDEYDVFLDEVTRKRSHQMLTEYVNNYDQRGRQFIIITPHKLDHIKTTSQVRIIKMKDPERHSAGGLQQQTL